MSNAVQKIETEVTALSEKDLCAFRAWFFKYDAAHWDEQLARDVRAGKLNDLAAEALEQYGHGQCKRL
jgi:hypothetical protein